MSITQEKIALAIIKGHINSLPDADQKAIEEVANTIDELVSAYNLTGEGVQHGSLALALVSAEYAAEGVEGE